jgi:hypothetical protein
VFAIGVEPRRGNAVAGVEHRVPLRRYLTCSSTDDLWAVRKLHQLVLLSSPLVAVPTVASFGWQVASIVKSLPVIRWAELHDEVVWCGVAFEIWFLLVARVFRDGVGAGDQEHD